MRLRFCGVCPLPPEAERLRADARDALLAAFERLGFSDTLPAPDGRKAWAQAAPILRAQARPAAPIDIARLLATGKARSATIRSATTPVAARYPRAKRAALRAPSDGCSGSAPRSSRRSS